MELPKNRLKEAITGFQQQIGLWCTLPSGYTAEALALCGYDWILFDTEHAPGDSLTVIEQLRAVAPYEVSPVVRPLANDPMLIKRMLDIGATSLLLPFVEDRAAAESAVRATRYPPAGDRGMASMTRAARFGTIPGYVKSAHLDICVLVQIETVEALANLEQICSVEGVDGVFVGAVDLSASMGFGGDTRHPEVRAEVESAVRRIRKTGKPAGVLAVDEAFALTLIDAGSVFTAVAVDASLLVRHASELAKRFRTVPVSLGT